MARKLLAAVVMLAAIAAVRTLRLDAHERYVEGRSYEAVYYVPPPQWLPVLSLGYRDALADLLWARALVYFGEELGHQSSARFVFDYADAMLALDDHFKAVYEWVATAALYRPTEITEKDGQRAVAYLERAVALWPDDGELAWKLGATLRFELVPLLKDKDAAEEVSLRGTEYLETAARMGAGPPWLSLVAASGLEKAGRTEQAIRHMEEVYQSVTDPAVKAKLEARLARLRGESYANNLRRAVEAFERERQANYPYIPASFYMVLGPRPSHAWAEAVAHRFHPEDVDLTSDEEPSADAP